MKVPYRGIVMLWALLPAFFCAQEAVPDAAARELSGATPLEGVWQNSSRFVEFSHLKGMRVVLKPYYSFVYDPYDWLPCAVTADPDAPLSLVFSLTLRYPGEKKVSTVPAALIGDSLFFSFFHKTAAGNGEASLDGFYRSAGNADGLRLYRSEPEADFFSWYFSGNTYYRIRYWAADVRFKDIDAQFKSVSGEDLKVPKFIEIDGILYTCITSTGKILRNYESGVYSIADGFITFSPSNVVFAGTAAAVAKPLRVSVSQDGSVLAFGEPYLVRTPLVSLDSEIASHNALRRPRRKPIFGFMDLDFYWDEIARIRGNTR